MRVAVVHEWLTAYAGSEKVLERILRLFPGADLYVLVDFLPGPHRSFLKDLRITTSFLQGMPFARSAYRSYLPLMPRAVESFDLTGYDLVLSSSHCVAKGATAPGGVPHLCYCHTPVRYAWDLRERYLEGMPPVKKAIAGKVLDYIKRWDAATAGRVTAFAANSAYIRDRIRRSYGREAEVVHPPVDMSDIVPRMEKSGYFVTASRMVPYKMMDLVVEAFGRLGHRLLVAGDGPEMPRLRGLAGPNVEFTGFLGRKDLLDVMAGARAFVFAAEEDFGIMPVEAMACGTPLVAFGRGGVTETCTEGVSGVFFGEQTVQSVMEGVEAFIGSENNFDYTEVARSVERFGPESFDRDFMEFVGRYATTPST